MKVIKVMVLLMYGKTGSFVTFFNVKACSKCKEKKKEKP